MRRSINRAIDSVELSKIFHEIRNPLTLINSSLQLIQDEHPEVKDFQYWNQTMEDIKNLRVLLEEISDLQKGDALKIRLVNLFDFTEDLIESTAGFLFENGTSLKLECNITYLDFHADEAKLRQAVINLLKNAAESTVSGKPIHLKITAVESTLAIIVEDHGCGMTKEDLKEIFKPFHTTKPFGTGLGLPIIKKIVEAHQGLIAVDSIPGEGTTVGIYLPII